MSASSVVTIAVFFFVMATILIRDMHKTISWSFATGPFLAIAAIISAPFSTLIVSLLSQALVVVPREFLFSVLWVVLYFGITRAILRTDVWPKLKHSLHGDFKVGDQVKWSKEAIRWRRDLFVGEHGRGPFQVIAEAPTHDPKSAGHHQAVKISNTSKSIGTYSGKLLEKHFPFI